MLTAITHQEVKQLAKLEDIIQRGLTSFVEVGNALLAIRDGKLYRSSHKTFDKYCHERWGLARATAYQYLEAAQVVNNLSAIADILPSAESQVRPMAQLAAEQQQAAWAEAVKKTNGKPTAAAVERAMDALGYKEAAPLEPQAFNVWSFQSTKPSFGKEYPGNIPGDIIQNLLWLYTEENAVVIDPFAGGGVTHDVCRWWSDTMWPILCASFDAQPCRPEIIQHDITTGFPKSAQDASLIFLDPPYWKQKRGEYSGGINLADLSLSEFHEALEKIIRDGMARLIPDGHLALLIGATRDGQRHDHAAEMAFRLHDLELEERTIATYSTQQAAPYHVSAAKNGKFLLNRYRDLMVWEK